MWPFSRRAPEGRTAIPLYQEASYHDRLNHLESRISALELEHAERQVTVMTAVEKVLHQLQAREKLRRRVELAENPSEDAPGDTTGYPPPAAAPPTAHLSRRFRTGG